MRVRVSKNLWITLALLISTATISIPVFAVEQPSFIKYGSIAGFPQIGVNGICQDKAENIWVSSESGIVQCYNGYDIVFKGKFPGVSCLSCSDDGEVFFLSGGKIYRVSSSYAAPIQLPCDSTILSFGLGPGKRLAATTASSIGVIDSGTTGSIWCPLPKWQTRITRIHWFGDSVLICYNRGRMCRWTPESGSLKVLHHFGSTISSLCPISRDSLLVATLGSGLFLFNPETGESYSYPGDIKLSSKYVHDLCMDSEGRIWIGTKQGLDIYSPYDKSLTVCRHNNNDPTSLAHDTVRRVFKDCQGGIWLSTYFNGLNYWHPSFGIFSKIKQDDGPGKLNDFIVCSLAQGSDGLLWLGTNRGGLNCYNPRTGMVQSYFIYGSDGKIRSEFNDIKAIWLHPDGNRVFVGTHGSGLAVLDRKKGTFSRIESHKYIYSIIADGDQRLLLGSTGSDGVIWEYDFVSGKTTLLSRESTGLLLKDSRNILWTNPEIKAFTVKEDGSLSLIKTGIPEGIDANCAAEDANGNLWFAGESGLLFYDRVNRAEWKLRAPDIPTINSIAIDTSGIIWLGTENGLFKYRNDSGRIRKYDSTNGLASDYFCLNAVCKSLEGDPVFGGIGGVSIVHPMAQIEKLDCPVPVVSELFVNENKIMLSGQSARFRHNENRLSFRLSSPDYCSIRKNTFAYKLEGYDNDWYYAGKDRLVTYPMLPKGSYHLKIKVSRNGTDWTSNPNAYSFVIMPVWYKTRIAIVLWILLVILMVIGTVRFIIKQKEIKNKIKLHEIEEKYTSELKKLKVLRFINAAPATVEDAPRRDVVTQISDRDESFLSAAISEVERHLSDPDYSIDGLAGSMKISRMTLHSRIKQLTGESSLAFIHKIRFSEACRLLKETDHTVTEVCYLVGFKSPASFSTSFKKYVGCSPQEYIKRKK